MIEITAELLQELKILNSNDTEFKKFWIDENAIEIPVGENEHHGINKINAGGIGNVLEYERRLSRFLVDQLNLNKAKGQYLDIYGKDNLGNERPRNYDDQGYIDYLKRKTVGPKETPNSIILLLQELSSEEVIIIENGSFISSAFFNLTYCGYYEVGKKLDTGEVITPAIMGGSVEEGTDAFYFIAKLQPKNEVSERVIINMLQASHVGGVGYDIEYYYTPSWH